MGFEITYDGVITIDLGKLFDYLWPFAIVFAIALAIGFCIGFFLSHRKNGNGLKHVIEKIYGAFKEKNIENIVFFIAIFLVLLSIVLQCFDTLNGFSNTIINIFGTLIVSWIATKKNSEEEIRKKEQENAKKSRRYLNSIKTTATNAIKIISECIKDEKMDFSKEQVIVLERAKDQVEHIEIGIETALNDWEDMMSQEDINMVHGGDDISREKAQEAAGTVPGFDKDKFESEELINQEEA